MRYGLRSVWRPRETTEAECEGYTSHVGPAGSWHEIVDYGDPEYGYAKERCVFRVPWTEDEPRTPNGNHPDIEREYERLLTESGWVQPVDDQPSRLGVVEMCAPGDEQSQPCFYGNLVEGHAVYCHNEVWLYAPRKCRRTWYTGGEVRDEDCPGYRPNPKYKQPHA